MNLRDLCPYCNWRGWLGALAMFSAFAVVGTMEYEDELRYRDAAVQMQKEYFKNSQGGKTWASPY